VRSDTEGHIATATGAEFGVAQTGLRRHEQHGPIAATYPGGRIRGGDERGSFLIGQEFDRRTRVALVWDRQYLLALERVCRLRVRDESKERADGGEPNVAGLRAAGPYLLKMIEECADEFCVEILEAQPRRRPRQALGSENQHEPERVSVGGDCMRTRTKLQLEPVGEKAL
jgi:hypothetical protein